MAGAQAVLLALMHRAKTGRGQWLDVSQFEAMSSLLETLALDMSVNGQGAVSTRAGNRLPYGGGAPHGAYRCRGEDRWVAITVFTDEEWRAFVEVMGHPQWADGPRFATAEARERDADALDSLVESWTIQQTAEEVMGRLQAAGVAAGVVQTGEDMSRDPQLKERGFFRRVPDHQGVERIIESAPYKLSRTPGSVTRGAPAFAADMTYVLRELLGMSDDEVEDCAIAGAFD